MDPRLEAHRAFLPDEAELARLEMQADRIRTLNHGRTSERRSNQSYSHFIGRGIDFEEVRPYSPGDDIRAMDWRVTARTGKPHVKVYREENQSVLVLAIQVSGTMLFGSEGTSKLAQAVRMAALLAFAVQRRRDRVGILLCGELGDFEIPPSSARDAIWRVLDFLSHGNKSVGRSAPWGSCLATMPKGRTVVVLSDFLDWAERDWQSFRQATSRHRLYAVHVYDPRECAMPDIGLARMSGPNGDSSFLIDTGLRHAREAYAMRWENHRHDLFHRLSLARAPFWSVSTADESTVCVGHMAGLMSQ